MPETLLAASGLTKRFELPSAPFSAARAITAVDGISIRLERGETLGLAGESGCGKSTVARLLAGLITPSSGDVLYRNRKVADLDRSGLNEFRRSVQMVFQDPYSSLNPRMRIGDIIAEPLVIHGLARKAELRGQVINIMQQVGMLPEMYDRYPHEFSGGQRQRIGIARAIALKPQVIVADEPLSALDISIQAQIVNLLLELQQSLGLAYILISHDLAIIRHLSSRIAVMYLGRVVEQGRTDEVFANPLHPYTRALLAAIPDFAPATGRKPAPLTGDIPSPAAPPDGCHFHTRCPHRQDVCMKSAPALEEKAPQHLAACHFSRQL